MQMEMQMQMEKNEEAAFSSSNDDSISAQLPPQSQPETSVKSSTALAQPSTSTTTQPASRSSTPTLRSVKPVAVNNEQLLQLFPEDEPDCTRYVILRLPDSKLYVAQMRHDIGVQEIRAVQLGETLKVDPTDTKPTTVLISADASKVGNGFLAIPICSSDREPERDQSSVIAPVSLALAGKTNGRDSPTPNMGASAPAIATSASTAATTVTPIQNKPVVANCIPSQTVIRARMLRPENSVGQKRLVVDPVCPDPSKRLRVLNSSVGNASASVSVNMVPNNGSSSSSNSNLTVITRNLHSVQAPAQQSVLSVYPSHSHRTATPPAVVGFAETPAASEAQLPLPPRLVPIGAGSSTQSKTGGSSSELRLAPPSLTDYGASTKLEAADSTASTPEPLNLSKHQDDEEAAFGESENNDAVASEANAHEVEPASAGGAEEGRTLHDANAASIRLRAPSSSSSADIKPLPRAGNYDPSMPSSSLNASVAGYAENDVDVDVDDDVVGDSGSGDGDAEASYDAEYDDCDDDGDGYEQDDSSVRSRDAATGGAGASHQKRHSVRRREDGKRHNEPLRARAVTLMQRWFDVNRDNPYPDEDIKARFAQEGGITMQQVNGWFANRRNRTNSTRPKIKRKILEERIRVLFSQQPRNVSAHLDTLLDLVSTSK